MSKVRINDLAKELEVKSRAILDVLPGIGVPPGKTHSSSLELDEAEKVRAHFARESRHAIDRVFMLPLRRVLDRAPRAARIAGPQRTKASSHPS